jgi:hypothetical protein
VRLRAGAAANSRHSSFPRQALPLCRARLLRIGSQDPELPRRIARWIADLDADAFEVREKATLELMKRGKAAAPAVRLALDNPASLEARRRLERVLAPLHGEVPSGDTLRALRAVDVLEQVGTSEAEEVLRQEARAALARRVRRPEIGP